MLLRRVSGGRTFIVDVHDFRLQKGLELGAVQAIHNHREEALEMILAETGGAGVDCSYEAVGMEMTLVQALQSLRKGGTATLLGIFEESPVSVPVNLFVQKEIALLGSQGYNWDFPDALALLDTRLPGPETPHYPPHRPGGVAVGFRDAFEPGCPCR